MKVNLWHGVGLKAVEYGDKGGFIDRLNTKYKSKITRLIYYDYLTHPDILVTTSEFTQRHFSRQFRIPINQCPILGYPRVTCSDEENIKDLSRVLDRKNGFTFNEPNFSEVYLYVPTWRDSSRSFLNEALPDLKYLNETLTRRNAVLYIKLHPWTRESWEGGYSNILSWPNDIDIYTYITSIDILITDYSSILYDFLPSRDGGIIIYAFDLEQYLSEDRAILYSFEENTAGLRVENFSQLCEAIAAGSARRRCAQIPQIRAKFWADNCAQSSSLIVEYVSALLLSRRPPAGGGHGNDGKREAKLD